MTETANPTWFWELRGEGEFNPPNIATIGEGWEDWKHPLTDAPPVAVEVFVRELVQNFIDAAREAKADDPSVGVPTLQFRFVELSGVPAVETAKILGLGDFCARYRDMDEENRLDTRLGRSSVLEGTIDPLKLLVVTESGTTGMYGPWELNAEAVTRKMRGAVLDTVGDKNSTKLGAYGEGKRAVIAASRCHSVLIYTCFGARPETGAVTRRFIGATYWRRYPERDGRMATGLALLGSHWDPSNRGVSGRPKPLNDEDADRFVVNLGVDGFSARDASNPAERGSSHLFVDPVPTAKDVRWALERNWWPLILDGAVKFTVVDYDGSEVPIDLSGRPDLQPFFDAYRRLGAEDQTQSGDPLINFESTTVQVPAHRGNVGQLGLMADRSEGGWSWRDREKNHNLVAIIRDGMIVEYESFPRKQRTPPPYVRGVFRTDSVNFASASKLLRNVEPPLHNRFVESGEGYDPDAVKLAANLYRRLDESVREFRKPFRDVPPPNDDEFVDFGEAFGSEDLEEVKPTPRPRPRPRPGVTGTGGGTGGGRGGGSRTDDPWINQDVDGHIEAHADDIRLIRATATRKLGLKPKSTEPKVRVRVKVGWSVLGDKGSWETDTDLLDEAESSTAMPEGFTKVSADEWVGDLTVNVVQVKWISSFYPSLWTVKPVVEIKTEA